MPPGHWHTGAFLTDHGQTLLGLERYDEAEAELLEAYAIFEPALGPEHEWSVRVVTTLVRLYGELDEARPGAGYEAKAEAWQARLPVGEAASP